MTNSWKRKALALLSVPLLAVPSAVGVYTFLEPTSGQLAAILAAAGFEVLYIGVNILVISTAELRRYARNVSLCAVATAVLMNTIAHYHTSAFDLLALFLAIVASLPLATLAYAVSVLLHRLSEADTLDPRVLANEVATLREQLAAQAADLASRDAALASATMDAATARETLAASEATAEGVRSEAAHLADQLRSTQEDAERLRRQLAERSAEAAALSAAASLDLRTIAQALRDAGVSLRTIGGVLGVSEKTIRNWTVDIRTNGHTKDVPV